MSTMSQIKDIVYNILLSNGKCTINEIQTVAIENGIIIQPGNTIVRSTVYQLMKRDPCIQRYGRGRYKYVPDSKLEKIVVHDNDNIGGDINDMGAVDASDKKDNVLNYLDSAEEEILKIVKQLAHFNLLQASDLDIQMACERRKKLKAFYTHIGNYLNEIL